MMGIVFDQDMIVAAWAGKQLGVQFEAPFTAIGVTDDNGVLIGASVFNAHYAGGNLEWTHVGPGTLSRRVQRAIMRYAFIDCGASRLTAKTARRNMEVSRLLLKAGFAFECIMKRYFGPTKADDALVHVLYKEHAGKWLTVGG